MNRYLASLLSGCVGLLVLGISAAAGDTRPDKPVITGAGAHFAWVVFKSLKADLERVSGRSIELHGQNSTLGMGCNAGIKVALNHTPEHETFGFVCCPLSQEEVEKKQLIVYPIALEPVMIVVNADNPVSDLSTEQVRGIMRGDILNWKAVGGNDEPIVLVSRLHCKSRPGHWKTILPDAGEFRQQRLNVSSAADMVQRVSDFKGAIGHIGSTWDFSADNKLKVVAVDGYKPTAENLANRHYPFFRNLSAVTNRQPSDDVLTIINEVQKGVAFERVAEKYELLRLDNYEPSNIP
jgi:phosphate transport system substrate-binding protein